MNNISLLARLKQSVDTARHARASMQSRRRDRARWLGDRASIFRPSSRSDQRTGFGEQADSWVSRAANKPISPDAMSQIFGKDSLEAISRQAGISPEEVSHGLSQLLPEVVDRMTPDGEVPDPDALANSVDDFARRLGLS
jgi:YidB-like protein